MQGNRIGHHCGCIQLLFLVLLLGQPVSEAATSSSVLTSSLARWNDVSSIFQMRATLGVKVLAHTSTVNLHVHVHKQAGPISSNGESNSSP